MRYKGQLQYKEKDVEDRIEDWSAVATPNGSSRNYYYYCQKDVRYILILLLNPCYNIHPYILTAIHIDHCLIVWFSFKRNCFSFLWFCDRHFVAFSYLIDLINMAVVMRYGRLSANACKCWACVVRFMPWKELVETKQQRREKLFGLLRVCKHWFR